MPDPDLASATGSGFAGMNFNNVDPRKDSGQGACPIRVGSTAEFLVRYPNSPKSYLGKDATLNGADLTVAEIEVGEAFTRITLNGPEQAP